MFQLSMTMSQSCMASVRIRDPAFYLKADSDPDPGIHIHADGSGSWKGFLHIFQFKTNFMMVGNSLKNILT